MKKLIFNTDYDFRPSAERRVTRSYKASKTAQAVNDECAVRALALGVATEAPTPKPKAKAD